MVNVSSSSAKLCVNVLEFHWWFEYYIFDITRSCLPSSLIFNVSVVSVVFNMDNPVSQTPFEIPLAWLFVFELDSVAYFEGWWFPICGLLGSPEAVII